jgi:hypothetical protein
VEEVADGRHWKNVWRRYAFPWAGEARIGGDHEDTFDSLKMGVPGDVFTLFLS